MSDQTQDVNTSSPENQSPETVINNPDWKEIPEQEESNPLFDIPVITAEEAEKFAPNSVDATGIPIDPNRPKAGKLEDGEPTAEEIHNAWVNKPSEDLTFEFAGETLCIVDLTKSNWSIFVDVFITQAEKLVKEFTPIILLLIKAWAVYRNLGPDAQAQLKTIAKTGTAEELQIKCFELGATEVNIADIDAMRKAAEDDKHLDFILAMMSIFLKPLFAPAGVVFENLKVSELVKRLDGVTTDLAFASISSIYLRDRRTDMTKEKIREEMELLDGLDELNIIYLQFCRYWGNGKLASFFPQIKEILLRNLGIGTL